MHLSACIIVVSCSPIVSGSRPRVSRYNGSRGGRSRVGVIRAEQPYTAQKLRNPKGVGRGMAAPLPVTAQIPPVMVIAPRLCYTGPPLRTTGRTRTPGSRIVGLNPWHWTGAPGSGRFEPGLAEMPAVLDAVRAAPLTAATNREVVLLHTCCSISSMCYSTWLQHQRIGKEIVSAH